MNKSTFMPRMMTIYEFKSLITHTIANAISDMAAEGLVPIGISPTFQVFDKNEMIVNLVMEEDNQKTIFIKVNL